MEAAFAWSYSNRLGFVIKADRSWFPDQHFVKTKPKESFGLRLTRKKLELQVPVHGLRVQEIIAVFSHCSVSFHLWEQ